MGQKTTSKTIVPPPSAEETRLTGIAAQLGGEQLSAIQEYAPYREMLFSMIPGLGKSISRDLGIRGAEFRTVTPEERAYRQFLNTKPGGGGSAAIIGPGAAEKLLKQNWDIRNAEETFESAGFPKGQITRLGEKRAKKQRAANAAFEAQKAQELATWQAQAEDLRAKAEAAKPTQDLGLDGMDDQDAYDYGFSPYERDLVNELASEQYELGSSDINAAYKESLGTLAQELAPARGLRGYDSPILDRGGKLAIETLRQRDQLSRGLRAQSSQQLLGLSEQAKANRMSLLGFLGNQGEYILGDDFMA